jgi:hypothetical protein
VSDDGENNMAEILSLENSIGVQEFFNVTASVGKHGVNSINDVFLVQALLKAIPEGRRGGVPDNECPQPTGTFDKRTERLIRTYQRAAHKREKAFRDGVINRAVGFESPGKRRPWTILRLNYDLIDGYMLSGSQGSHIGLLLDQYPELNLMLLA